MPKDSEMLGEIPLVSPFHHHSSTMEITKYFKAFPQDLRSEHSLLEFAPMQVCPEIKAVTASGILVNVQETSEI